MTMKVEELGVIYGKAKPYLAVFFLQGVVAELDIICKAALDGGMSNYVLVVYRYFIATLFMAPFALVFDRKSESRMTPSIFAKVLALGLLEPVIDQNLYYLGMKYTSATFASAMVNVLPAITFIMACLLRLEKLRLSSKHCQTKIVGTLTIVGGVMIMAVVGGPFVPLSWNKHHHHHQIDMGDTTHQLNDQHTIKGAIMIMFGMFTWSGFMILQVYTLREYPAELSLTVWICFVATVEGAIRALLMENNSKAWHIKWDTKLLATVCGGILCSGMTYYIQGVALKEKDPVFVSAFSPICLVLVDILSSFLLGEQMYLGRIIGAIVIIVGLYMVIWGKMEDYRSSSSTEEQEMRDANNGGGGDITTTDGRDIIICEK